MNESDKRASFKNFHVKRVEMYGDFMVLFCKSITQVKQGRNIKGLKDRMIQEMAIKIREFNARASVLASDEVLLSLNEHDRISREALVTGNMMPVLAHFTDVCLKMRQDINPGTKITKIDILKTIVTDVDEQPELVKLITQ